MMRPLFAKTRARITWARTVNELARAIQYDVAVSVRDVRTGQSGRDVHPEAHGVVSGPDASALDAPGSGGISDQATGCTPRVADACDRVDTGWQA